LFNFHKSSKPLDWYDFNKELGRLNEYEGDLIKRLEVLEGDELTEVQQFLNRIAYERARIKQLEKEHDNDV